MPYSRARVVAGAVGAGAESKFLPGTALKLCGSATMLKTYHLRTLYTVKYIKHAQKLWVNFCSHRILRS
jgi:hypothetical protein